MVHTHDDRTYFPDYDLLRTEGSPLELPMPRRAAGPWIVVAGLLAAAVIAAYILFGGRISQAPAATPSPARVDIRQSTVRPLGGEAAPVVLPPLDETDSLVRDMVKQLTAHPRVAAWLTTEGLIRNFVAAVSAVAEGRTPAALLRVLGPSGGFHVIERGSDLYIDARSYERYDSLAEAVASVEPAGAARLYATLKPRIEEAYRDLGVPETSFDRTLEGAVIVLLETPVSDAPVQAQPHGGVNYAFAAPDFEALPAAQKQLLRMGPRNVRTIQSSLREIALALGIPAERLPRVDN